MQLSVRQITGAFRPLSIRQQSYRVPPCVGSSNALDAPSEASTQIPFTFWRNSVPGFFAQTAHTLTDRPDRPKDADAADADVAVPKASLSDLENLFKQHVKSVPKGSRPSSASPCVLDDTQHPIKASSLPTYAWPFLTRLRLAGTNQAQQGMMYLRCPSMVEGLQVMMSSSLEEQCETCCSTKSQRTLMLSQQQVCNRSELQA